LIRQKYAAQGHPIQAAHKFSLTVQNLDGVSVAQRMECGVGLNHRLVDPCPQPITSQLRALPHHLWKTIVEIKSKRVAPQGFT